MAHLTKGSPEIDQPGIYPTTSASYCSEVKIALLKNYPELHWCNRDQNLAHKAGGKPAELL